MLQKNHSSSRVRELPNLELSSDKTLHRKGDKKTEWYYQAD